MNLSRRALLAEVMRECYQINTGVEFDVEWLIQARTVERLREYIPRIRLAFGARNMRALNATSMSTPDNCILLLRQMTRTLQRVTDEAAAAEAVAELKMFALDADSAAAATAEANAAAAADPLLVGHMCVVSRQGRATVDGKEYRRAIYHVEQRMETSSDSPVGPTDADTNGRAEINGATVSARSMAATTMDTDAACGGPRAMEE